MPAPGVTWLASYPKSGSTWLRFICFHLVNDRSPTDSRELDAHINSRTTDLADRPGAFVKTHAAVDALGDLLPLSRTAIYVHRHPLDVLCSALNYDMLTGGADLSMRADAASRDSWIEGYLAEGGHPPWRRSPYFAGSWTENVESWTGGAALPFVPLTLSYDDLADRPDETILRIADHIGLACDPARARRCAEATGFQALRRFEERELAAARASGAPQGRFSGEARLRAASEGLRFFNSGRSGGFRDILTAEQIRRGRNAFGPAAEALGYVF